MISGPAPDFLGSGTTGVIPPPPPPQPSPPPPPTPPPPQPPPQSPHHSRLIGQAIILVKVRNPSKSGNVARGNEGQNWKPCDLALYF